MSYIRPCQYLIGSSLYGKYGFCHRETAIRVLKLETKYITLEYSIYVPDAILSSASCDMPLAVSYFNF